MDTSSNYPEHHFVNNWTQVMNHSLKILYSYRYIQGVPEKNLLRIFRKDWTFFRNFF
jgi:hypothetical protein